MRADQNAAIDVANARITALEVKVAELQASLDKIAFVLALKTKKK